MHQFTDITKKRWELVILFLLTIIPVLAQSEGKEIGELQADMYKYFSSPEQEKFMEVTEQLKKKCLAVGDEQTFYKAWGNQAIYLSTHEQRSKAIEIVDEMRQYASDHESHYGEYTALHVQGTVYLRMQNYAGAEVSFKDAATLLHSYFPDESAAADYLELIMIANRKNDSEAGKKYGEIALREPNIQPQHQVRVFSMLCQYAYTENDRERFNELYEEWKDVLRETTGGSLESTVEVEYLIINERYAEALQMCEQIPLKTRGNFQSKIYHLMGNDAQAYKYLKQWNTIKDSISREEQANVFSEYLTQSAQNERLEQELQQLEEEKEALRTLSYIIMAAAAVIIITLLILWRRTLKAVPQPEDDTTKDENDDTHVHPEETMTTETTKKFLT